MHNYEFHRMAVVLRTIGSMGAPDLVLGCSQHPELEAGLNGNRVEEADISSPHPTTRLDLMH